MSLLTICTAVADQVGITIPSTIVGNPDPSAKRLLALANTEGKELAKLPWTILDTEHQYVTSAGVDTYDLPDDFESLNSDTSWDRTNYWNMRGSLTPREWGIRKNAIIATTAVRKMFRIKRGAQNKKQFFIDPVPPDQTDMVFEYRSKGWCQSSTGVIQTQWLADTDTGILDEWLMELGLTWRYLNRVGLPYIEEYNTYMTQRNIMRAQDASARTLNPRPARVVIGAINVPEGNYG